MRKIAIIIGLLAAAITGTAFAQWEVRYLLFTDGQIYTLPPLEGPQRHTACMPEGEPIQQIGGVSGDARWFAMLTTPADVAAMVAAGEWPDDLPVPNNVWICSTREDATTVLYLAQPDSDASDYSVKSQPVWNPTTELAHRKLAFTDVRYNDDGNTSVMLYHGQPNTGGTGSRAGFSLPGTFNVGITTPPRLWWGNSGIVVELITEADDGTPQIEFLSYTTEFRNSNSSAFANRFTVTPPTPGELPLVTELTRSTTTDMIALLWQSAGWQLVNSQTGAATYVTGSLELYNTLAPQGTTLVYDHNNFVSSTMTVYSGGRPFLNPTSGVIYNEPSIAPVAAHFGIRDTGQIIHAGAEGIFEIFNDGRFFAVEGVEAGPDAVVLGGPLAYRFRGGAPRDAVEVEAAITAAAPIPNASAQGLTSTDPCPEGVPPRLIPGAEAVVIDTLPNNVRAEPVLGAPKVGEIAPGEIFAVIEGPVCADGYAWWNVQYAGGIGWTVEGENTTYWLAPLTP